MSLTGSSLDFETPYCIVALNWFEQAGFVWIFRHEHGRDETTPNRGGTFSEKNQRDVKMFVGTYVEMSLLTQ